MNARLLLHRKRVFDDGAILEMKIWEAPQAVRASGPLVKYSLFYGRHGVRLVGDDNEAGKGDHRHHGVEERDDVWRGPHQLMTDFLADVRRIRKGNAGE